MQRVGHHHRVGLAALLALATSAAAWASPVPPPPLDELAEFYDAMDGEAWHRSDDWLDEDIHPCQWYGIYCESGLSLPAITSIRLPSNNLSGELEGVSDLVLELITPITGSGLDLSGNLITGAVPASLLAGELDRIGLHDNQLSGALPEASPNPALGHLNLSGNELTGPIPDSWAGLELRHLDLGDNQLEGDIEPAVSALTLDENIHLRLAGNAFGGPLPEELMALNPYPLDGSRTGPISTLWSAAFPPGLDLCWNDFDAPDADLAEFINAHHHGGGIANCQGERSSLDPAMSGSWFDPDRDGEGFVQHLLDNGQVLQYWFTFPRRADQQQAWHFGLAPARETSVRFEQLYTSTGRFSEGRDELEASPFRLSVNPIGTDRQVIDYSRSVIRGGSMTGLISYGLESNRSDHVPLTRLAGSDCDNQPPYQWLSGAWYDPERDGEGFMVEVNNDGLAAVYWFTHVPDDSGEQAWMTGTGEVESAIIGTPPPGMPKYTVTIDNMVRPTGTLFGSDFQPDDIDWEDWGNLTIEFFRDRTGHVYWDSIDEDFGSGDYPIEPLARPKLAECD